MSSRSACNLESLGCYGQRKGDERHDSQKAITILEGEQGGVAFGDRSEQAVGLLGGVGGGQVTGYRIDRGLKAGVIRAQVLRQHRVMELQTAFQHGSDKGDAETA